MKSLVFAVAKGGVGKSVLTVNVAAALALKGHNVAIIDGDPTTPLQLMCGLELPKNAKRLHQVVQKDLPVSACIYETGIRNMFLVPSGVSLADFFTFNPMRLVEKLSLLDQDFVFVDIPFPMGEAAVLGLGFCQYIIPIVTENEFVPCVSGAIDTMDVGRSYLGCLPVGYVLNKIMNVERFDSQFVERLSDLMGVECIGFVKDDPNVARSFGGAKVTRPFIAYQRYSESEFARAIDKIASALAGDLPQPLKTDAAEFMRIKLTASGSPATVPAA